MVGRNNAYLSFMPAKDAHKQWKTRGVYRIFLKKNNGLQTAVRGGSERTLIPQWATPEKGGVAQKDSPQGQKSPLHRDKSSKKAPA